MRLISEEPGLYEAMAEDAVNRRHKRRKVDIEAEGGTGEEILIFQKKKKKKKQETWET